MNLKLSDLLFKGRKTIELCPGVTTGTYLPVGSCLTSSRHLSGKGPDKGPAISRYALALDKIISQGSVSALGNEAGQIYAEVASMGSVNGFFFDGNTMYTTAPSEMSSARSSPLVPILLHLLCIDSTETMETKKSAEALSEKILSSVPAVADENALAYFCDCAYYDGKDILPEDIPLQAMDSTMISQIEQSARTNNLLPIKACGMDAFLRTSFTHIHYSVLGEEAPAHSSSVTDFLEECKTGAYEIGYEWSSEQQSRIRPFSFLNKFVPNEALRMMTSLAYYDLTEVSDRLLAGRDGIEAIGDNYLNMILVGKPGTGKTTTAEALSAALGLPIYTVPLSKNTEEDTIQGMTKVVEGGFSFKETPFLEAYEHGGIIVLEEFNLADPGMMQGALGQAIEYPFVLYKDGYQEVHRHPLCVIISTMNTATQGAREPNEALTSRSPIAITMEDPNDQEFLNILAIKGYDPADCKKVFAVYKDIIKYLKEQAGDEELVMCVTLRHCLGALKLMKTGIPLKSAVKNSMIGSIAIKNLDLANEIFKSVVEAKRY